MPDSWAKAFRPTIALFRCTARPVIVETIRLTGIEPLGLDAGGQAEVVVAGLERHDDLFERGVAGALADAVDRALDLPGAGLDAGQAVGDGQAQVVVAVRADDRLVDVAARAP